MIDLHSHILPGIDDGAEGLAVALEMARLYVADGVTHVACTPHILPGVYRNTGPQIRKAVNALQETLDAEQIALKLLPGADNHIVPDFASGLGEGRLLTLADSRYVLVEPPHHVAPPRVEEFFSGLVTAGYVPILTHPERLSWIEPQYETLKRLVDAGTWMQVTAGSLAGHFGKRPQSLAYRMLEDGLVHILATDAHDATHRPPRLSEGWQLARERIGEKEAECLVLERPFAILCNEPPSNIQGPAAAAELMRVNNAYRIGARSVEGESTSPASDDAGGLGRLSRGLRKLFK